ncbi:MAG: endonuclease III [Chloroflexota bacterium]
MDEKARLHSIADRIREDAVDWRQTSMTPYIGEPFKALIAAMLSAQTREEATTAASEALFEFADTPEKALEAGFDRVRDAIRPASFYTNKAKYVLGISEMLITEHNSEVPRDLKSLMALPGVGHKVGTLVQYIAYGIDEHVVVDVHVDRISKRLGIIPPGLKGTEKISGALNDALPRDLRGEWNELMVMFGRNVCIARRPRCTTCMVHDLCPRVGVDKT